MVQRIQPPREAPEQIIEKLFPAAFSCFSERGFERTTMEEIASRCGVARATLYYYFRGKDDLFLSLLDRGFALLGAAMREASEAGGTARDRLAAALDRIVELIAEYRDVAIVVLQQLGRLHEEWEDFSERLHREHTAPLRALLEEGAADGSLRPADAETLAPALFGGLLWSVLHHAELRGEVPVEHVKAQIRALVMEGLGV